MTNELTEAEKATNSETLEHIQNVRNLLNLAVRELLHRGEIHDQSKLGDVERKTFVEYTPRLKASTYGSEQYKGFLREMKAALDHHYAHNRHHPEHFGNGISDMNLLDVLEMLLDWKAATMRHADGDLYRSLDINMQRFGIGEQLQCVLQNTVRDLALEVVGKNAAFQRGYEACQLDSMENAAFGSIGGIEARASMKAPDYVPEADRADYLRGYAAAARMMYGADWRTCGFSWKPALTVDGGSGA